MDLDEIFKNNHRHHQKNEKWENDHYNGGNHSYYSNKHYYSKAYEFFNIIKNNKKLKIITVFVLFIVIAIIIGLIVFLFPLITKILNYIFQNGASGVIDIGMDFLNKLLNDTN